VKSITIDFSKHKLIQPIVLDYISGNDFLKPFYKYSPSPDSVSAIIKDKSKEKIDRALLAEVISKQYSALSRHKSVEKNISLLTSDKTFTVTTGHQLNLFTGPLYFIYKIVTVIQLADELSKKYSDYSFVPFYWMASEDHDFAEINHINLFGEKIEWSGAGAKNFGGPSGKLGTQGISSLIDSVKKKIENEKGSEKIIELLNSAYSKHDNLADATRYLVNELFGKYGLIILDANDSKLKKKFAGVMKDDLLNHSAFNLVSETSKQLEKNYEVQVHPREINLFYMTDGSRERITGDGEKYVKELEVSPELFSPNVVLRPLYQELILPNVAMVGGPAEIAYWLQYKKMFEHYTVNFPMLIPRKSFQLIDGKAANTMQQHGLDAESIFLPADDLVNSYVARVSGQSISLEEEKKQLEKTFSTLGKKISAVDATLEGAVDASWKNTFNEMEKLEAKLRKAEKNKHDVALQKIKKLKEKLFPNGKLQERHDSFIPYYLKYGDSFFETLLNNGEVFEFGLNVVVEE
jgi:bacillithiol synthase